MIYTFFTVGVSAIMVAFLGALAVSAFIARD